MSYSSYFTSLLTKLNLLDLKQNSQDFSNFNFEMLACDVAEQPHSKIQTIQMLFLKIVLARILIPSRDKFNPFIVNNDTICVKMFEPFEFNVIKGKKVENRCCCCPDAKCPPKAQHVQV